MADEIRVLITDKTGKQAEVVGTPGTNFGLRLSAQTVLRLEAENGLDNLPFIVMAAGYGDDEDWVAIQSDDLTNIDPTADELGSMWGPFEITAEDPSSLPEALLTMARFQVRSSSSSFGDGFDDTSRFWVNDTETDRTVSRTFRTNGEAIAMADSFNADPSKAYPIEPDPIFQPGSPRAALATIREFVDRQAPSGIENINRPVADAIQTLEQFVADMLVDAPKVDELRRLAETATWEPRPDWGEGVEFAYHGVGNSSVTDALDWQCTSCRPDVGWPDWSRMQRTITVKDGQTFAGPVEIHVECGHCGSTYTYDLEGEETGT